MARAPHAAAGLRRVHQAGPRRGEAAGSRPTSGSARAGIPDVTVVRDDDGREAPLFRRRDVRADVPLRAGRQLLFSGGTTGARGHAGDNAGRATLLALLNQRAAPLAGRRSSSGARCSQPAIARGPRRERGSTCAHATDLSATTSGAGRRIDAAIAAADALYRQHLHSHLPAHRPPVRPPDGAAVGGRHRLRALGVAAGLDRLRPAGRTCTCGRRSCLGGAISVLSSAAGAPAARAPRSTRYTIATAQMLMSALLIHLTGGRIETHFHVFGSLAFLAFYRDWRVLVPATVVVAPITALRGIFWPQSVYGVLTVSELALGGARRLGRVRGRRSS